VKVSLTLRAAQSFERISARWRKFADSPSVFAREFLHVTHLLETTRSPGAPWPSKRHPDAKRILMPKSSCHVYFKVDDENEHIRILEIWDARRKHPPKL
jgi:hypothetical protein